MKLLVIEDEIKSASYLQRGLTECGFSVDLAYDGEEGLHLALTGSYDLIVIDVMLPGRDGWSVITELRKADRNTLALFLSARDELCDRVKGLELGADGYLVKPFAFSELIAQIRSLLRRGPSRQLEEVLRIADLEIDFSKCKALRAGAKLPLTPKEFQLLSLLARRAGEVVSRAVIAEKVWGVTFDSDTNVVDVHINRLRSKVDQSYEGKLIQTIRGMGYMLREDLKLESHP